MTAIHEVPPDIVRAQLEAVFGDIGVDAAKTGMLFSAATIETVADFLSERPIPLVVDPVMIATSGARLLREDAVAVLVGRLFPLATVVTPNLPEACALAAFRSARTSIGERSPRPCTRSARRRWSSPAVTEPRPSTGSSTASSMCRSRSSVIRAARPTGRAVRIRRR